LYEINSLRYYECAIIGTSFVFSYSSKLNIKPFDIVLVTLRSYPKKAIVLKEIAKPNFKCIDILEIIYSPTKKEIEFMQFISYYYFCSISETAKLFYFQQNQKNLPIKIDTDITLSPPQLQAYNFCKKNQISILFGDTGSGKTEIYIKLIEETLNKNQTALLLLPEIAITSQIEKRLSNHFHSYLGIWHSKITKNKKNTILNGIKNSKIRVIVGARSALFLPMENLGLIIVDEFHDDSYKSQSIPLYNAKDLAIYKAKLYNIKVVLGSATPLVSDIYKHPYFRLKGNFYNTKNRFSFVNDFTQTFSKIDEVLSNNGQIIIFIPTRANFKYMICKNCTEAIKCPFCDVAMSIHSKDRVLKCHYCNYSMKIPNNCPVCKNDEFLNRRIGSSEIVQILKENFDANIQKFDKDIITSKSRLDKILKDFNDKKIDILVGTQMISKGHDYDVDLVIVLDIDFLLNMADFRARERAISLVKQVAGRAGRRKDGEVIIQTINKEFFLQSYDMFIKEELEFRKDLEYPPFSRIVKLEFSNKDKNIAYEQMIKVYNCLKDKLEILGFGEAPIFKISNKYRYNIIIKGKNFHKTLWECKDKNTKIDTDSINFI
jgi:primosomal protein N' (replication factor Y)